MDTVVVTHYILKYLTLCYNIRGIGSLGRRASSRILARRAKMQRAQLAASEALQLLDQKKGRGKKEENMFSPGIEPGTFCVLDSCDNRYTTKTW